MVMPGVWARKGHGGRDGGRAATPGFPEKAVENVGFPARLTLVIVSYAVIWFFLSAEGASTLLGIVSTRSMVRSYDNRARAFDSFSAFLTGARRKTTRTESSRIQIFDR